MLVDFYVSVKGDLSEDFSVVLLLLGVSFESIDLPYRRSPEMTCFVARTDIESRTQFASSLRLLVQDDFPCSTHCSCLAWGGQPIAVLELRRGGPLPYLLLRFYKEALKVRAIDDHD